MPETKIMSRRSVAILVITLVVCLSRCRERDLSRSRDGLVAIPGAVVSSVTRDGEEAKDTIKYAVRQMQPDEAVRWVADRLRQLSWTPLAASWDEGGSNSFVQGWSCHPDANGTVTYVWVGDWISKTGDVVTYSFTTTAVHSPLEVSVDATLIGEWHVRHKVDAHGEPNVSLSEQCTHFIKERQ